MYFLPSALPILMTAGQKLFPNRDGQFMNITLLVKTVSLEPSIPAKLFMLTKMFQKQKITRPVIMSLKK